MRVRAYILQVSRRPRIFSSLGPAQLSYWDLDVAQRSARALSRTIASAVQRSCEINSNPKLASYGTIQ